MRKNVSNHYVGQSTTELFDFYKNPPEPLFEEPVPTDGLLYCISQRVVPQERNRDLAVIVLDRHLVLNYAAQLKEGMGFIRAHLCTSELRHGIEQHLQEERRAEAVERAENPENFAVIDRVFAMMERVFGAFSRGANASQYAVNEKIDDILSEPLYQFFKGTGYQQAIIRREKRKGLDAGATQEFNIDTGIPGWTLMSRLVFDVYVARQIGAEVVTNSSTRRELENARRVLTAIESRDIVRYLTVVK